MMSGITGCESGYQSAMLNRSCARWSVYVMLLPGNRRGVTLSNGVAATTPNGIAQAGGSGGGAAAGVPLRGACAPNVPAVTRSMLAHRQRALYEGLVIPRICSIVGPRSNSHGNVRVSPWGCQFARTGLSFVI